MLAEVDPVLEVDVFVNGAPADVEEFLNSGFLGLLQVGLGFRLVIFSEHTLKEEILRREILDRLVGQLV